MKAQIRLIALFICSSFTLIAQNQEYTDSLKMTQLMEVTIIGTSPYKIVGSGALINAAKLQKLNQTDINKVLQTVAGINIRDEEGFGLRPNIGLRGTPVNRSAKITLMEDGILIAPAPYADPSAYYFPTFARMEQVEVLKGSSQVKYGPYTIGGAINLISTSIPDSFKAFAQVSYGSFGTNQQRIWVGDSQKNIDYVFEINRLASQGFKQLDQGGNTGFDRRDFMGKVRWHSASTAKINQSLTLKLLNMSEDGNETYLGLTYADFLKNSNRRYAATQKDLLNMTHQHASLSHHISLNPKLTINTSIYASKTFRDWGRVNSIGGVSIANILANPLSNSSAYQLMTGQTNGNLTFQNAARTFYVFGIQSNLNYQFETGSVRHNIQAGIRLHQDEADRYATSSTYAMNNKNLILTSAGVKGNAENQLRQAKSFATYISYELAVGKLTLSPGIRYESMELAFDNYGNNDNARLGTALKSAKNQLAIYLPGIGMSYALQENMRVFGGIHKGFSPPGMPSVSSNAVQARSETATNYEVGYRFRSKNSHMQLIGFYNNYQNILGSDNVSGGGAGTGDMFNAGNAAIKGIEFSLEQNLLPKSTKWRLPLNVAYTYNDAKFLETFVNGGGDWGTGIINKDDRIPFITPHLLTTSISLESDKMNVTLISRYVGQTRVKNGSQASILPSLENNYANVNTISQYWVFDISANYRLNANIALFTTINNVLNERYIVANLPQGYRPGMPASINLGAKFNL